MTTRRRKYAVGGYEQIRANNTIDVHGFNIGLKKIVNTAVIFKKMLLEDWFGYFIISKECESKMRRQ